MERAIETEGPVLEDKGIHPIAVDERDHRKANEQSDKSHPHMWPSSCGHTGFGLGHSNRHTFTSWLAYGQIITALSGFENC